MGNGPPMLERAVLSHAFSVLTGQYAAAMHWLGTWRSCRWTVDQQQ